MHVATVDKFCCHFELNEKITKVYANYQCLCAYSVITQTQEKKNSFECNSFPIYIAKLLSCPQTHAWSKELSRPFFKNYLIPHTHTHTKNICTLQSTIWITKAYIPKTEPIQFTAKRSPNAKDGRTADEIRKLIDR